MYTLDASVFARDLDVRDPAHATCHALIQRLASAAIPVVVPTLLLAEIAATIITTHTLADALAELQPLPGAS